MRGGHVLLASIGALVCTIGPTATTSALPASYFVDDTVRASGPVALVGDSLTISDWNGLPSAMVNNRWGPFQLEARSGRRTLVTQERFSSGLDGVRRIRASGFDPPVWVIALGTNDLNITARTPGLAESTIDTMLDEIGTGHRVVWVNVYSKYSIANSIAFNNALDAVARRRPMLTVVDWFSLVALHPEWLHPDGVHPNSVGAVQRNTFVARESLVGRGAIEVGHQAPRPVPVGPLTGFVAAPGHRFHDTVASSTPLQPAVTRRLQLPADVVGDATGAVVNLTATSRGAAGYVVAWDCSGGPPATSNLNFAAHGSRAATAIVHLDTSAGFCVRSSALVDLAADLEGVLSPTRGSAFVGVSPARLTDTRQPPRNRPIAATDELVLALPESEGSIPPAAAVNVTVVRGSTAHVSVAACGTQTPPAVIGDTLHTVANAYWTDVSPQGTICVRTTGNAHVVVDLFGVFVDGPGAGFQAVAPVRLLDTRNGTGGWIGMPTPLQRIHVDTGGLTAGGGAAVTVTATRALSAGYFTAWPCPVARPLVSSLNVVVQGSVANLAATSSDLCVSASPGAHLIVDLVGRFVEGWVVTARPRWVGDSVLARGR